MDKHRAAPHDARVRELAVVNLPAVSAMALGSFFDMRVDVVEAFERGLRERFE